MPLYLFDGPGGDTIEERVHGTPPDTITVGGKVYRRRKVQPFAVVGMRPAPTMGDEILRGYHAQECALGSRFRSRFRAETIRREWSNDSPIPDGPDQHRD